MFEGDATFSRNEATTNDSDEVSRAGAISNTGSGSITFKGALTMEDNDVDVGRVARKTHVLAQTSAFRAALSTVV